MKSDDARIMRALIEKEMRLKKSAEQQEKYLETGDPQIVIDLIFSYPNALQENRWLVDILAKWLREGEWDLLKRLVSLRPGQKRGSKGILNLHGITVAIVNELTSKGVPHEKAFKKLASLRNFSGVDAVKKSYYKVRKKKPQEYIEETEEFYILTRYNTIIKIDDKFIVFGDLIDKIPKDSTKMRYITFTSKVTATYNKALQLFEVNSTKKDRW